MKKLIAAISILFMVILVESSSGSFIFRVDPPSSYTAVVEDEISGSGANSIESEPGSFLDEVLDGSAWSVFKYSQWEWLFH